MKLRPLSLIAFAIAAAALSRVPAGAQSMFAGLPIDGIKCEATEGAVEHLHVHLQIFDRGRPVPVPSQVGIPAGAGCLYWLHTHAGDGIIHIEAPVNRTFTLGQFLDVWGKNIGPGARVTVNGKGWKKNPRAILLRDREEIVVQHGPPYAKPHGTDWSRM